MGTLNPDAEPKQELDDSGYVQDEVKPPSDEYKGTAELLDLSDDVLLYIFKSCSPQDLKALGFTCARLGALVLDRTLWVDVDACAAPLGRQRVRWLLTRALGAHTKRLRLKGYAEEADGCLGYANRQLSENEGRAPEEERYLCGGPRVYRLTQSLPRFGNGEISVASRKCVGPRLTLTHTALRALGERCPELTILELEYCVIDCQTTNIGLFPKTLKRLSLKGTKCFNLEAKSFLFKIQDHLVELEELDVSYCSWIEPACMLPLSKMPKLRSLAMRECHKLAEFVAYASLATRYGFKKLEQLDLRGSPVGDSEVSALGWLPRLASLKLSPAPSSPRVTDHAHYAEDLLPADKELEEWEEKEPEYFKPPSISEADWMRDEDDVRGNQSRYYATCEDPTACILLERMIAEPVNPDEYSQVYHQFLAGHNNNVPLASPDEYRESYRQFMIRPTHGHPPAGYSLFIRKAEADSQEAGPSKRRKHNEGDTKPGTSTDDAQPGTSKESKPDKPKSDSDSSDSKDSRRRTRWGPKNDSDSDSDGPPPKKSNKKKKKDDDRRQPRRVFEITINELNRGLFQTCEARNIDENCPLERTRHQSCQTVDLIPCDAGTLVVDSAMQTDRYRPISHDRRWYERSHSAREPRPVRADRPDRADRAERPDRADRADRADRSPKRSKSSRDRAGDDAVAGSSRASNSGASSSRRRSDEASARSDGAGSSRSDEAGSSKTDDAGSSKRSGEGSSRSDEVGSSRRSGEGDSRRSAESNSRRFDEAGSSMTDEFGSSKMDKTGSARKSGEGSSRRSDEVRSSRRSGEGGSRWSVEGSSRWSDEAGSSITDEAGSSKTDETGNNRKSSKRSGEGSSRRSDEGSSSKIDEASCTKTNEASSFKTEEAGTSKTDEAGSSKTEEAGTSKTDEASSSKTEEAGSSKTDEAGTSKTDEAGTSKTDEAGSSKTDEAGSSKTDEAGSSKTDEAGSSKTEEAGSSKTDEAGSSKTEEASSSKTDEAGTSKTDGGSRKSGEGRSRRSGEGGSRRSGEGGSRRSGEGGSRRSGEGSSRRSEARRNEARARAAAINERRIFQFRQYRRPIVIEEFINVGDPEAPGVLPRGVLFPGCTTRLDPAALVSDSSIRRFGRAIGENINYIHIGGGGRGSNARPDRSSLVELSVTGFRHVTDASLTHLATAAPLLRRLDLRGTGVTLVAVERFRAMRPDVEVVTDAK